MKRFKQFLQRWLNIQDLLERVYDIERTIILSQDELEETDLIHWEDSPVVIEPTVIETPKPEVIKGYEQRHQ